MRDTFKSLNQVPAWAWLGLAFWVGACVGSFLNVVVYRVPLGLSVNQPRRSFCPSCRKQLAWWHNIPLVSWPLLRGRCAMCGERVSVRYWVVELLTASLFLVLAWKFPTPEAFCYMVFVSLLIAGAFIDVDHMIIPHRITFGIMGSGLVASTLVPSLMAEEMPMRGLLFSLSSAGLGLGLLWTVVELGKLLFGKLTWDFDPPSPWEVTQCAQETPPILKVGDEELLWSDVFQRPRHDCVKVDCTALRVNGRNFSAPCQIEIFYDRLKTASEEIPMEKIDQIAGTCRSMVIPREAMGFADVLLIAGVGAYLGWKAVLFTILVGSLTGSLWGLLPKIFGEKVFGRPMPFGPHLALGAVLWLFIGPQVFRWYWNLVAPSL